MPSGHREDARNMSGMASESRPSQTPERRVAINGRRLGLNELSLGTDRESVGGRGRWARFVRALEHFLAGMYTGESCAGTPRDEHGSAPVRRTDSSTDRQTADRVKQQ